MTWLITGCSSGFGLALARIVQANGHNLIATSRNPGRTPDLVNEVTGKGGQWLKLNTDDPNCGQIVEGLEEQGTEIDVLVNSAGFGMSGAVESFQEEEVRRVMETNFYGPWRLMKAAVPYMRRRRRGMVVNLSSGSGMEPPNSLGIYGASKAALDGELPNHCE
jgi:short-subunit dehydrogenase